MHSLLCCRVLLDLKKANYARPAVHDDPANRGDGNIGAQNPRLGPVAAAAELAFARPHTLYEAETVVNDIALEPRDAGTSDERSSRPSFPVLV